MPLNMGIEGTHYTNAGRRTHLYRLYPEQPGRSFPETGGGDVHYRAGNHALLCCASARPASWTMLAVLEAKENCIIPFLEESNKYVIPARFRSHLRKTPSAVPPWRISRPSVDEMVMKFITGREPIENWDTYVAKVKEMGIENVIGIYQEALDAWNS